MRVLAHEDYDAAGTVGWSITLLERKTIDTTVSGEGGRVERRDRLSAIRG
jgi:hypothetical protein